MKRRILPLLLLSVICLGILCPSRVLAVSPLDPGAEASLKLYYQKEEAVFSDLQISIFRVAEMFPDGTFELIEPFASYPINIHGITAQEQWNHIANTLCAYIVANQVTPDRQAQTDETGIAFFAGLETGLYFVSEVVAEHSDGTYIFNQFLVYLPTPQPDGSYAYAVEAKPKCTSFVPKTQYTVTKLWQDGGNQNIRPEGITVDIYKDGVLQESQVLDPGNNWSYTWHVSGDDHSKWTVTERSSQEHYDVTIQQNGSTFSIINTYQTPTDVPNTGDTFSLLPWILIMCISGVALLLLGIYGRRRK